MSGGDNLRLMSQTAFPVTEAAKNFLRVVEEVERKREPAVLTRGGRPVATLNPLQDVAHTCAELADRWQKLERLPTDEAIVFACDLELGRATLPPIKPAWD
jgi:antitoxin (DNA-binding transcriptional repressor) of toxin-antitoxin stability system